MTSRTTATVLGVLFLTVMVTWSLGFWLIDGVLNSTDFLVHTFPSKSRIFLGVIFELIEIAAIIGIVVTIFPLMKQLSERMAVWYAGFRILESVMLTIAGLCALGLLTLSQQYIHAGSADLTSLQTVGNVLVAVRQQWVHLVLPFFYSGAGILFFVFLYRTELISRFISIIGIVGATLVLAGIPLDFFEIEAGAYFGALMGLTEIFLGIWLITKGFNSSSIILEG